MLRRWLKPCPRCRGNHLLEMKDDTHHAVRCMQCGYLLLPDQIRFLAEDVVLKNMSDRSRTAA
jgi:Zn ribbon nucleic-acid-binding protein